MTDYRTQAITILNTITCNAIEPSGHGTIPIYIDDVTTQRINLHHWYREIEKVTDSENNPLEYTFDTPIYDIEPDTLTPTAEYGKMLTLKEPISHGSTIFVSGKFGFQELPQSLSDLAELIRHTLQSIDSGEADITSKSIEDVSVSYQKDTTQTALQRAITPYTAVITKWRLCDNPAGVGQLAMPQHLPNPPYWLGDSEAWTW